MGGKGSGGHNKGKSKVTPAMWEQILGRLEAGETITSLDADPALPSRNCIKKFRDDKEHPERRAEFEDAIETGLLERAAKYKGLALDCIEGNLTQAVVGKNPETGKVETVEKPMSLQERDMRARNYLRLAQLEHGLITARQKVEVGGSIGVHHAVTLNMTGKPS